MRKSVTFRSMLAALACAISLSAYALADTPRKVDLPAGDLSSALQMLAKQSGVEFIYSVDQLKGVRTAGARGDYTTEGAVTKLLEGTKLTLTVHESGALLITPLRAPPGAPLTSSPTALRSLSAAAGDPAAENSAKEGKKDSSREFRMAQVDRGEDQGAGSVGKQHGTAVPATSGQLEEIVVTALHRSERLQDIPVSITAIEGDELADKGAQDYNDYLNAIPGVTYVDNGYIGSRVAIRGIADNLAGTDPLTGIYIDEAPITEAGQPTFDPSLYDVDRVEVLKGPQGTLYGAGSMGGTVRIIMKKPVMDEFQGSVESTLGSIDHGGDLYRVDGVLNIPLVSDVAAFRLVDSYRHQDGFIDNVQPGAARSDVNSVAKENVRAQLLVQPEAQTSVLFSFMYQKEDLDAPPFSYHGLPHYEQETLYPETGPNDTRLSGITIQHEFDSMTLTSATNYLDRSSAANIDVTSFYAGFINLITGIPVAPNQGLGVITDVNYSVFSQEVRLASKGPGPIRWLGGIFYSDSTSETIQKFDDTEATAVVAQYAGTDIYIDDLKAYESQLAAFGELTYDFTSRLTGTVGARVLQFREKTTEAANGLLNGGASTTDLHSKASSTTQKYLLDYKLTDDNHVYVEAAQGFRAGGPNAVVPTSACGPDLATLGYATAPSQFNPDKLWNFEIGSKNALFDRRDTLNGAAYYIDWNKIQSTIGLPNCGFGFTTNAGKAVSKGFEMEVAAQPIKQLTVSASFAYTDAKITQAAAGTTARDGDQLPFVARVSWNAAAQYDLPLTSTLTGFSRVELNRVGSRWNQLESVSSRSVLMDPYVLASLRIGISGRNWSAAIYGTNLFDRYVVTWEPTSGAAYDVVGPPRIVGLNARYSF